MKRMLLFFFIFWLITIPSYSQDRKVTFESLSVEQGLSHHFTMTVMQDRKGFLWFGTGNGLDKYDGYQFTHYKFDLSDTTSLTKNQVFTLWEDIDGVIWVGTSEGICKFDPRNERFTRIEQNAKNPFVFKYAQSFNEDAAGNFWVGGGFAGELRLVDRKTGKFSTTNYANMLGTISDTLERLHFTYKDKLGTLWVGSPTGLHRLNLIPNASKPSKISFTHYRQNPADTNSLSHNRVTGIYEDRQGILWIMTHEGVLNSFDRKSGKFTRYPLNPNIQIKIYGSLKTGIAEDREGNLWISTFNNGLYKLDKERKKFTAFVHDPTDPGSIINNSIFYLIIDNTDILWAASMEGIIKLDPNRKPFGLYRHNPFDSHSLSHNQVAAICEDKEGIVWIGTKGGGLNALDKNTKRFTHYRHNSEKSSSLRSNIVGAILEDRDGDLWVGNGNVLSRFDRKNKSFQHFSLPHPFLNHPAASPIYTICEDQKGIFWLGTDNGIASFNRKTGKTVSYPYDPNHPERISDYWALSIVEDRKGNLWIGPGSQALMRFDPKTGTFTHYKHDSRKAGSIPSNTVPSIYEDSKGNLWFGTGEGLCLFNPATETFTTYTEHQGLAGNSVFSILEDNADNLWLGTSNGLSKFSLAKQTFTNYSDDEGLQSKLFTTMFTEGAAFKGKDGMLYFGGSKGFNAFDPATIRLNTNKPPVVITQFKIYDKLLPGKHEAEEIKLDYEQNFLSFEFATLNYTNSSKNQYAYRLVGLEKDWVYSGSRRYVSYTNLSPGDYTFRVKGSNNDGIWNEQGTSLHIIIHPPWWRTWWAYSLYGIAFSGLVLGFIRFRIRKEREKQALERERWEAEQLRSVDEMKTRFFSNITHEFRTPLSLILPPAEQLLQEVDEPKQRYRLNVIKRNAHQLLGLINQLLDISKIESGNMPTAEYRGDVAAFTSQLLEAFRPAAEEKGIRLVYTFQGANEEWLFDADKWSKIINNLLSNALKFTPSGGEIKMELTINKFQPSDGSPLEENFKSLLIIQDTGIGIPAQKLSHIFDRFYQADNSHTRAFGGTGIGLSLVKELIELLNGQIRVNSSPGAGTTFTLELPIRKAENCLDVSKAQTVAILTPFAGIYELGANTSKEHFSSMLSTEAPLLLLIDDNADLREFIAGELSNTYRVLTATNGEEGWQLAQQELPEVIISDVMMPVLDGYGLTERLKTNPLTNHIAIILLTAKAAQESKVAGLEHGADDYLTKPFHLQELKLRLRNLLDHQQKLREHYQQQLTNPQVGLSAETVENKFLHMLYQAIEEQLDNSGFDVDALAEAAAMSRRTLYRKLATLTGLKPNEVIQNYRLLRATQLLQAGQSVSQVAYQVGFESPSYFGQCFKEKYQITPSEYIQQHLAQF